MQTTRQALSTQIMVIDVPRKICRPKVASIYQSPLFSNDVDEGIFLFEELGRTVFNQHLGNQDIEAILSYLIRRIMTMNFLCLKSTVLVQEQYFKKILKNFWDYFVTGGI